MEMNRHKMREVAMTSLYQHLLLGKDIRECVYENCDSNDIDPFLYTITMDTVRYKDAYIDNVPKAIVIDEAVSLAKKYCDEDAYKLINGVLDQL